MSVWIITDAYRENVAILGVFPTLEAAKAVPLLRDVPWLEDADGGVYWPQQPSDYHRISIERFEVGRYEVRHI